MQACPGFPTKFANLWPHLDSSPGEISTRRFLPGRNRKTYGFLPGRNPTCCSCRQEMSQYAYMHARMPWHACISVCILGVFLARGAPWGISPGEKSIVLGFLPRRNRLVTGWPTGSTKKGVKKGGRFHVLEMCVSLHFYFFVNELHLLAHGCALCCVP
jgi:hypothetical protein